MTQRERSVWSGYPTQAKTRLEWGTEAFFAGAQSRVIPLRHWLVA
jgi:hypothetical protein